MGRPIFGRQGERPLIAAGGKQQGDGDQEDGKKWS